MPLEAASSDAASRDFFISYNRAREKKFKVLDIHGPKKAEELAREGMKRKKGK